MSKHLFIGGPVDGQRLESDPSATFWRIPIYTDHFSASVSYHEYVQMQLMSQTVYVSNELDVVGTLDLLVGKYPNPKANDELKRAVRRLGDMLPEICHGWVDPKEIHELRTKLYQLAYEPNPTIP